MYIFTIVLMFLGILKYLQGTDQGSIWNKISLSQGGQISLES